MLQQNLRRLGKPVIATLIRRLPRPAAAAVRRAAERLAFRLTPAHQALTLPDIFHYWAGHYVQPLLRAHGYDSPEDMYLKQLRLAAASLDDRPLRIVSAGSGDGELEVRLAAALAAQDVDFRLAGVDLNPSLVASAQQRAHAHGLGDRVRFMVADCNRGGLGQEQDVILVNQFLHHVEQLEEFCRLARAALAPNGRVLTSDVVGRNGHLLWPTVRHEVDHFWRELPPERRRDRSTGRICDTYQEVNHAAFSSEGICAQGIVAELSACFDFELFITYGACIIPFVERRFGGNFDPDRAEDRAFIDQVQARDAELIEPGCIPASNMLAVLRHKGLAARAEFDPVSPDEHVRLTRAQQAPDDSV